MLDFNYTAITAIVDVDLPAIKYGGLLTDMLIPVFLIWNVVGIIVELLFIRGIHFLMGWHSNFSFTMLFFITFCALEINAIHRLATVLTYFNWFNKTNKVNSAVVSFTVRFFGTSMIVPYITMILSNISLTIHRIVLTLKPVTAQNYLTEKTLKTVSVLIVIFHIFMQILLQNTPIHAFYFIPKILDAVGTESFDDDNLDQFWLFFNVCTIAILISYPCLFFLLHCNGQMDFRRNKEIRMTLQKHFRNTIMDKKGDIFHKTMLNCMQSSPKLNEIIACQMYCYRDLTKWPKLNKLCEAQLNFYDRLIYVLKLDAIALEEAVYTLGIIHHGYAKYGLKPVFLDMWQQNIEMLASKVKFPDEAEKEQFLQAFAIFNTYVIETMNMAYLKCQMDSAKVP